jgi:hypothetical protein
MSKDPNVAGGARSPLASLRRFARPPAPAGERCELCSADLAAEHAHLVEPASRRLLCACEACALLFSGRGMTKYRRVPRRILALDGFRMSDAAWDALQIPIGLAFFFHSSPAGKVIAFYPSPAGATEALLDLRSWEEIVRDNPILTELEEDTEALLVNRLRSAGACFLVPIDECYKLVGLLRSHWRGLSGGDEVHEEMDRFFGSLSARATAL